MRKPNSKLSILCDAMPSSAARDRISLITDSYAILGDGKPVDFVADFVDSSEI